MRISLWLFRRRLLWVFLLIGLLFLLIRELPVVLIDPELPRPDILPTYSGSGKSKSHDKHKRQRPEVIRYDTFPKESTDCIHLKLDNSPILCVFDDSIKDLSLSDTIRRGKFWEPNNITVLLRQLRKDSRMGFIDIGCNVGEFSIIAASMGHRVVAVDAVSLHTNMLAKSVILNGYQDRVTIVNNAISNEYGRLNFSSWPENRGSARIRTDDMNFLQSRFVPIAENVSTILMDDLLDVITFNRAIIKIDIEGHEVAALSGAKVLFDTLDIPLVFCEWWGTQYPRRRLVKEVISFMSSHGYRAENINGKILPNRGWQNWPFDIVWVKIFDPKN